MYTYTCLTDCCNISSLREKGYIDNSNCRYELTFEDEKIKSKTVYIFYEALKSVYDMFLNFEESTLKKDKITLIDDNDREESEFLYISISEDIDKLITLRFKANLEDINIFNQKFIITYDDFVCIIKDMEYILNYNKK